MKTTVILLVCLLLIACGDETLVGRLTVSEEFTYIADSNNLEKPVRTGTYTAYLKPPSSEDAAANQYKLTLVELGKPNAETQIIHIPIAISGSVEWQTLETEPVDTPAKNDSAELPVFNGSAYVPAHRFNQPFNLALSISHRNYDEDIEVKRDCKTSVASLKSDVGFQHQYYFDGYFLRRGPTRGPVHSMSLEFKNRPSYKKVSYSESGREIEYGLALKSPETQKTLAVGSAKLRIPYERNKVREFTCRPLRSIK